MELPYGKSRDEAAKARVPLIAGFPAPPARLYGGICPFSKDTDFKLERVPAAAAPRLGAAETWH